MKDLMSMMKQAQELQANVQRMQDELAEMEIAGSAGGGLVSVTLNGKGEMRGIEIDKSLLNPGEGEILEDLIVAACQDARVRCDELMKEKMSEVTGGLPLPPGLKLF
ncbi:MAG: YbaB/EbfC family nucleoid-associated protein [Hyphomicrobiaceae bacterium]